MEKTVYLVDDDDAVRDSVRLLLETRGYRVRDYPSAKSFLADLDHSKGCLVSDINMPEMDGLALQTELTRRDSRLTLVFITGHADVPLAVRAMRAGALDFIEKPFKDDLLLNSIDRALAASEDLEMKAAQVQAAKDLLALLTPRERDVLAKLVSGHPNKIVAFDLGISARTVEIHRANIMEKLCARSLSDLVRTVLAAG